MLKILFSVNVICLVKVKVTQITNNIYATTYLCHWFFIVVEILEGRMYVYCCTRIFITTKDFFISDKVTTKNIQLPFVYLTILPSRNQSPYKKVKTVGVSRRYVIVIFHFQRNDRVYNVQSASPYKILQSGFSALWISSGNQLLKLFVIIKINVKCLSNKAGHTFTFHVISNKYNHHFVSMLCHSNKKCFLYL